jgi:hypothetical protein
MSYQGYSLTYFVKSKEAGDVMCKLVSAHSKFGDLFSLCFKPHVKLGPKVNDKLNQLVSQFKLVHQQGHIACAFANMY